ncbi:MAG: cobalamin-dependent protein [Planctomycetota bacterium]
MQPEGSFAAALIRATLGSFAAGAADGDTRMAAEYESQLLSLAAALAAGRPSLLDQELLWRKVAYKARGVDEEFLTASLARLRRELLERLPEGPGKLAGDYLAYAAEKIAEAPDERGSFLDDDGPLTDEAKQYMEFVLHGERDNALDLVDKLFDSGVSSADIHEYVLARVQREMGRMWQMDEVHVGEEHFGSEVAEEALMRMRARGTRPEGNGVKVLIAAVEGNMHDLGARMVSDQFRTAGFETVFLGASTPAEDIVRSMRDFETELLVLSAHLAIHVPSVARTIEAVREEPATASIPILVGGPPFVAVDDLWKVVGADGVSNAAAEAVDVARTLLAG